MIKLQKIVDFFVFWALFPILKKYNFELKNIIITPKEYGFFVIENYNIIDTKEE